MHRHARKTNYGLLFWLNHRHWQCHERKMLGISLIGLLIGPPWQQCSVASGNSVHCKNAIWLLKNYLTAHGVGVYRKSCKAQPIHQAFKIKYFLVWLLFSTKWSENDPSRWRGKIIIKGGEGRRRSKTRHKRVAEDKMENKRTGWKEMKIAWKESRVGQLICCQACKPLMKPD